MKPNLAKKIIDHPHMALAAIAFAGAATVLLCTRWSIGLSPDSAEYLCAAENLREGRGLSIYWGARDYGARALSAPGAVVPVTVHPPLYPALLAALGAPGLDAAFALRPLNALLFSANIFLVGYYVYRVTARRLFAAWASLFMFAAAPMLKIHLMAWTEPLFLFWGLLGSLLIVRYVASPRVWFLLGAAAVTAVAVLTRYIGIVYAFVAALAVLSARPARGTAGVRPAVLFFIISIMPVSAWCVRNYIIAGTGGVSALPPLHPAGITHAKILGGVVVAWVIPCGISPWWKLLIVLIGFSGAAFFSLRVRALKRVTPVEKREAKYGAVARVLVFFIICYLFVLFLSISLVYADIPIDDRSLAPVFVAVLIFAVLAAHAWLRPIFARQGARAAVLVAVWVYPLFILTENYPMLRDAYNGGGVLGYGGRAWANSALVADIRRLPPATVIFSNAPEAIYLRTGRVAHLLPRKINRYTLEPNPAFENELALLRAAGERPPGVAVAYFNTVPWMWDIPDEKELRANLPLRPYRRERDGTLYFFR